MYHETTPTGTSHLLILHIGPVQEWIAQARRTRDSWFGSHYLSEVSKAAALAVLDADGLLIFPWKENRATLRNALRPCDTPWYERYYGVSPEHRTPLDVPAFNVANKIVAEVQGDPARVARTARLTALNRWKKIVNDTLNQPRCKDLIRQGCEDLIEEQRDTLLEFFAVWAPLPRGEYGSVFAELSRALNARKQLRQFKPWKHDHGGVYRSSLDGARASILEKIPAKGEPGRDRVRQARARLRIAAGEQLDAIGLAKRAGGGPDQFIPLVNVAMSEWIRQAHETCPDALEALRLECATFGKEQNGGFGKIHRPDLEWVSFFNYDAHLFHQERWEILLEEMKERATPGAQAAGMDRLKPWAEQWVRPVLRQMPTPPAYVACIIADGDHMGDTLKQLTLARQHQIFSERLSAFAGHARRIIEDEYHGSLVFSGGDDVFGWVAVEHAVPCAAALRAAFEDIMKDAVTRALELGETSGAVKQHPTLSVGIGVGHVMEAMGSLVNLARDAEKLAKGNDLPPRKQRNALGIVLDKRSGGRLQWRARWEDRPEQRLEADLDLLAEGALSVGKIHALGAMYERLPLPADTPDDQQSAFTTVLAMETHRILSRNEGRGGTRERSLTPRHLGVELNSTKSYSSLHATIGAIITRLMLALDMRRLRDMTKHESARPDDTKGGS